MFAKAVTTHEPEHRRILRANAAEFLAARPLADIRALAETRMFDREFFRKMAELGWLGMMFSSEGELDAGDLVALHRELGRKVLPEPVLASGVLAAGILAEAGNPAFAARLEQLCAGEIVATLAWQGKGGAIDAEHCGARARRIVGGWTIDGTLRFVPWASQADAIVVAAGTSEGVVLGWIPAGAPSMTVHAGTGVDKTEFATVILDGAVLTDDAVICGPERGAGCLDIILDLARLAVSAELVGAAEAVFEMTLGYLRERKQFGRPIGANQALQFVATDLFVRIELANSVLASAARFFSDGEARAARVAGCKSRCGDAAFLAARQAIQLHGAIGYTHECDVSLYVKRIMQLNAWLGAPVLHRQRIRHSLPALQQAA
ncbi:acyl-CoA dehydrogenase [Aquamicrobium sp. LC103]|uniref:acyl-CoA dehydrogenase family protein n=1 Tax=Aquamicrobium sp. LC103 TaxID=1120658 RepID=UPI00063ECC92|nr:acyl-CoA dehydrogenase [Aquamicrobium sp. LC103]TKT74787.1 acyl-CoA dehydrogenase [Aquamicrobium sp. LC103]